MLCLLKNVVAFAILLSFIQSITSQAQSNDGANFAKRKQLAMEDLQSFPSADTNRVNALLKVVNTAIFSKEKKEVISFLQEAINLSRQLKYAPGLGNCYLQEASYYKSLSNYPHALTYYDSALVIAGNVLSIKKRALEQKAMIFYTQENYYTALDFFFEALKNLGPDDGRSEMRIYSFIIRIYTTLKDLEKAEEFARKSVALVEKEPDIMMQINIYFSLIDLCLEKNDWKTATSYLDKISRYIPDPKEVQVNFGYYLKRGKVSYLQQNYREAFKHFKDTYRYSLTGGHLNSISVSLFHLSATALKLGLDKEAKDYALQNLELAEKMHTKSAKLEALMNLSAYYAKVSDNYNAYQALHQAMLLKDSLVQENDLRQSNVLGVMYKYGKQQEEISRLENEREEHVASVKRKSLLNYVFIASIIVLLFIGYLGYANFKSRQQLSKQQQDLQHQKIIELEKNKQLVTVDAMLKGQEEERGRIAKDLHDGLGSLLSGTKLSFMNVKEMLVLTPEKRILFERSLSMLDNTIGDLRKVAQNLMPEALVKFGLQEALRDFCDSIQSSSGIHVYCQQFGEKRKLSDTAEMYTYRIIQELVNNAVKHANPGTIMVQLAIGTNKTGITVEDDGKGFDSTSISLTKGAGRANINYRVHYFNGTYDMVTSPGHGTSVNIELIA